MAKKKKKIELHHLEGIFLAIEFMKREEQECFTDYGKGVYEGLIDPEAKRTCPVVLKHDYEELEKKYEELQKKYALLKQIDDNRLTTKIKRLFINE